MWWLVPTVMLTLLVVVSSTVVGLTLLVGVGSTVAGLPVLELVTAIVWLLNLTSPTLSGLLMGC